MAESAQATTRKPQIDRAEADEIIQAIRKGLVDAVLIESVSGDQLYGLHPFESIEEHNEILQAIRGGRVDALVIKTPAGDRVFSLQGSDQPYRILIETMQEGAATLNSDGTLLYANSRFAEMLGMQVDELVGTSLYSRFPPDNETLRALISEGLQTKAKGEVEFRDPEGRRHILRLALSPLPSDDVHSTHRALCAVATDVTELFEANQLLRNNEEALRMLSARLLRFQDDERKRISRELHDSAGQYLVGALMRLAEIDNSIRSSAQPEHLLALLQDVRQTIEACSGEIRTLSYLLHPPTLDVAGLRSALEWYSDGFSKRSGIKVDVEVTPSLGRLPQDLEIAIYRVVQEGLTNIHRHSGSRWAKIRLIRDHNEITLEVIDRGKGMGSLSSDVPSANMGVGISGMRERVRQLNGHLQIESGPQGTNVRVGFDMQKLPPPVN